jgi:HAD superfamily hydrolase (TIGR01484 family)
MSRRVILLFSILNNSSMGYANICYNKCMNDQAASEFPPADAFDAIAFDMDNTLAPSKSPIDDEMAGLICGLLQRKKVAVISGAHFPQFEKQLIARLPCGKEIDDHLENLSILATQGAAMYERRLDEAGKFAWHEVYAEKLTDAEKKEVFSAFEKAFAQKGTDGQPLFVKPDSPAALAGVLIEDRDSQITFSALGSEAPLEAKQKWDPDHKKRDQIVAALKPLLPNFTIDIGGTTSIDVTKKGIDKAYGLRQLASHLNLPLNRIIYVGDALFPEGNDAPVLSLVSLGIRTVSVANPEDTKKLMHTFLDRIS